MRNTNRKIKNNNTHAAPPLFVGIRMEFIQFYAPLEHIAMGICRNILRSCLYPVFLNKYLFSLLLYELFQGPKHCFLGFNLPEQIVWRLVQPFLAFTVRALCTRASIVTFDCGVNN